MWILLAKKLTRARRLGCSDAVPLSLPVELPALCHCAPARCPCAAASVGHLGPSIYDRAVVFAQDCHQPLTMLFAESPSGQPLDFESTEALAKSMAAVRAGC